MIYQTSYEEMFRELISLVGKKVEVQIASTGERVIGTVVNSMFDSFLLETDQHKKVISFREIAFLKPL